MQIFRVVQHCFESLSTPDNLSAPVLPNVASDAASFLNIDKKLFGRGGRFLPDGHTYPPMCT